MSVSPVTSQASLPKLLQQMQAVQSDMTFFSEYASVPEGSEQGILLATLEKAMDFIIDEIMGAESRLEDALAENDWVDAESSNLYFEFETREDYRMHTADVVISKRYIKAVMITVVYYEQKFLVTLGDAEKEQPLVDTLFPHVSGRRRGFQICAYDHRVFTKFSLWQADDTGSKPSGPAPPDEPIPTVDITGDGYTQTYIVMKPKHLAEGSTRRDVFFRFGSWCYAGQVDLGVEALHLGDVPEALPALQRQQSALSFMCESAAVPMSSPYAMILASYGGALSFFQQEIIASEAKLSEMAELGVTAWIEEDWGAAFFELALRSGSTFADVEMVAGKTYERGIVLHSVLFNNSLYAVLADADDDQPLLDVAFPDVTARCRGYQIKTYSTPEGPGLVPRRLSVWEGRRKGSAGVGWGASAALTTASILGQDVTKLKKTSPTKAGGAAGDSKAADEDGKVDSPSKVAEEEEAGGGKRPEPVVSRADIGAAAARAAAEKNAKAAAERAKAEGKTDDAGAGGGDADAADMSGVTRVSSVKSGKGGRGGASGGAGGARREGDGKGPESPARSGKAGTSVSSPIDYEVRAPHHLKPMGNGGGRLGRLGAGEPLGGLGRKPLGDLGPAPWDKDGRPVLGKKSLLK